MLKRKRVIVHIGIEKTGTTSIQGFLAGNRGALQTMGFSPPSSLGDNHTALCALVQAPNPVYKTVWNLLGITDQTSNDKFARKKTIELRDDVAKLPPHVHTVLLSSEHLHSNLTDINELKRLRALLSTMFDEIKVVIYLRRQDQVAMSLFSTRIKGGETIDQPIFPTIENDNPPYYWDFFKILSNYSDVFELKNLIVRLFHRDHLHPEGVVQDYCRAIGIEINDQFKIPLRLNESISRPALFALSLLNPLVPPFTADAQWNFKRNFLVETLEANFPSSVKLGSRAEASAFYENFRHRNERARLSFMPQFEAPLFPESFEEYPVTPPSTLASPQEVAEIFACLWNSQAVIRRELSQQLAAARTPPLN